MSDSESLELSAEDLMPAWVSGLEKGESTPVFQEPKQQNKRGSGGAGRRGDGRNREGGSRHQGSRDDRRTGGGQRGGNRRDDRGRDDRRDQDRRPARAEDILPQLDFQIEPTAEAVQALSKHIRSTNRAYVMSEVAKMVLASPDRFKVSFRVKLQKKKTKEQPASSNSSANSLRMIRCKTDGSVWLSWEEAVAHFLRTPELLEKFYQCEEVETEAPKGNFSVIAVCGMSGTILGPPNHHEYQQNVNALHQERFASMPLEKFKSRIEMRRDEETLELWKKQMSTSKQYRVLSKKPAQAEKEVVKESDESVAGSEQDSANEESTTGEATEEKVTTPGAVEEVVSEQADDSGAEIPAEGEEKLGESGENINRDEGEEEAAKEEEPAAAEEVVLSNMNELTLHFRENHAKRIFKQVGESRLTGNIAKQNLSPALWERMNAEVSWQKRGFPLPMIRTLCRRFEHQGLKFFKRGAKSLFVTAARPRALDSETVLTDRLASMLNYVLEKPGILAGALIKHLLPKPAASDSATASVEKSKKKQVPSETNGAVSEEKVASKPSKEELGLLADLRWLLSEGYIIEFPNSELLPGTAVTVNKRKRRPSKNAKKSKPAPEKPSIDPVPKAVIKPNDIDALGTTE